MGFNKRYVTLEYTMKALENNNLRGYYGKSDMLIFEDNTSSEIFNFYKQGKSDKEILSIINQNTEEITNEVYQSNQGN